MATANPIEEEVDAAVAKKESEDPPPASKALPALHEAAACGRAAEVLRLLRRGADARERSSPNGYTALHMAALTAEAMADGRGLQEEEGEGCGRADMAAALLEAGAEVNAATRTGCTPLHLAVAVSLPCEFCLFEHLLSEKREL